MQRPLRPQGRGLLGKAGTPSASQTSIDPEGYFRREWHYAADRAKNIAEGAYFIIPVAIDEISREDARVPECFRPKLWTRLPGGRVNPDFVQRMRQLTGKEAP
jgi:hypothetical protein